jgi:hypothetical protein
MVDGLHICVQISTKKPLTIALSRVGRWLRWRYKEGNVTNVQYKSNWSCHYEFTPV